MSSHRLLTLDGSEGEGGGQILRTALTLSLLTGRPFRLVRIRANRENPGLRPQHLTAVKSAARLGNASVTGDSVGSRDLTFRPGELEVSDLDIGIGTAGASALVLQTLHLPLATRATKPVLLTITGGTLNTKAPSYPFLASTWHAHMFGIGTPVDLAMPAAGFYPRGGGRLEATVQPARPRAITVEERGALRRITGQSGIARLRPDIAQRMKARAEERIGDARLDVDVNILTHEWPGALSPGAAIALTAECAGVAPATFVGLGEKGKPAEAVADEACDELLEHVLAPTGAVDPHSADQILLPLALAEGPSVYTVSRVTEHLRTNARTITAFLDRSITIVQDEEGPGRVVVD